MKEQKIVDLRGLELILPVDVLNISINGDDGSDGNEVGPPLKPISMVGGISTDLADDDVKVSDQDDLEPHTAMLERENKKEEITIKYQEPLKSLISQRIKVDQQIFSDNSSFTRQTHRGKFGSYTLPIFLFNVSTHHFSVL